MRTFMFICDRTQECRNSPRCGEECKHTADYKFAKYEAPKDVPEMLSRFEVIKEADGSNETWWEVAKEDLQ